MFKDILVYSMTAACGLRRVVIIDAAVRGSAGTSQTTDNCRAPRVVKSDAPLVSAPECIYLHDTCVFMTLYAWPKCTGIPSIAVAYQGGQEATKGSAKFTAKHFWFDANSISLLCTCDIYNENKKLKLNLI